MHLKIKICLNMNQLLNKILIPINRMTVVIGANRFPDQESVTP